MSAEEEKPQAKWLVKFKFKKEYKIFLIDVKDTTLFDKNYPVFKMMLARELLNSKGAQYIHVKRADHPTEITDPAGNEIPRDSCIFMMGISKDLGFLKLLFFPQPEDRLVLVGLDEVWIKVLENLEKAQRLTVITNVIVSFLTNREAWNQIYILY